MRLIFNAFLAKFLNKYHYWTSKSEYKDGKKDRFKEISYEQKEKLKEYKDVKKEKLKEFSVEKRGQIKDFSVEKREKIKEISAEKAEVVREKTREVTREVKERAKRENWYTIPNAISLSRIISGKYMKIFKTVVLGYRDSEAHFIIRNQEWFKKNERLNFIL